MIPAEKILVFLPNWVGDAVMATPSLRTLRRRYGNARITWAGRPAALAALEGCPWADQRMSDLSSTKPRMVNAFRMARQLRRERFELAVLLPNSLRPAAVARAGRIPRRVGYRRYGRGPLLTDVLDSPRDDLGRLRPVSALHYYADLLEHAGIPVEDRRMELAVPEAGRREAAKLLEAGGIAGHPRVVMINPGASFGPSKMWSPQRYADVADALIDGEGAAVVINAAPSERKIATDVAARMRNVPAVSLADVSNSLGLVEAMLARSALLITNDTGARHLAAALGTGVVTLFGSTDPRWAEIDYDRERQVRVEVSCSPCQQKRCPLPAGPEHHRCMERIHPEQVLAAARELLDGVPAAGRSPA